MITIIPKDAIIAEEKVRDYLLVPQRKNDKSKYLSLGGYSRDDFWELIRDIRSLLPGEGNFQERIEQGNLYVLYGAVHGPNGRELSIKTVWIETWKGEWKFVTLHPDKRKKR
ncbi:MAG TPA: hypothetical protein VFH95_04145 [Candidatus Kapabacteria bacterium]|nr:hypothetical protein [Candidatus Kapabacteria bacterium]